MSALKVPKHHHPESDAEDLVRPEPTGRDGNHWQFGDLKVHGAGSPARKLQSHLAERLHQANRIPIRGALATLAVLCLSLSLAGLYLLTMN
ncbi:hypothetical protein [Hyphomonas sp.]|uniref:hypothetical protein n=1 Tax=Hyphomonas sp. TaxID=87 RepID=UPI003529AAB8